MSEKIKSYRDLIVRQKAHELARKVLEVFSTFHLLFHCGWSPDIGWGRYRAKLVYV